MKTFALTVDYHGDAESWEEIRNNAENNKIPKVFIGAKEFVNVVRCEDCKYASWDRYVDGNVPIWSCSQIDRDVDSDWFCADGERKEKL